MDSHNLVRKELLPDIYPQLKQLSIERGLSLEELRDEAHITLKTLRRIESGKGLPYSCFRKFLTFYGKSIRIVIE